MTALRRAVLVGTFLGSSAVVCACIGDDPAKPPAVPEAPDTADSGGLPSGDAGDRTDSASPAPCDGGIMCESVCVDTSSDAKNCGRCAHDCGKGKCTSGVCQPVLIAGDADGGAAVITSLTTDQTDDNPKGLATHVFWSATGAGGGVFQDNVTGGNTVTLSTASAVARTNVVVDQANVFWFGQNFGGPPQPVLKGQVNTAATQSNVGTMNGQFIQSIMYDAANQNVLGSYSANSTTHGMFKCGPGGNVTCASLITFSGQPGGNVANDGTNVYFCDPDGGLILRTTFNGGSSGSYITGQATPNLLRVDGSNVYWFNGGTKTVQRGPLASATTPKQVASTTDAADALAADAVNAYWTESATGTLSFAPITGAGPNTPYVKLGASSSPMRLVRDTAFLYFSHGGGIYRVALP